MLLLKDEQIVLDDYNTIPVVEQAFFCFYSEFILLPEETGEFMLNFVKI